MSSPGVVVSFAFPRDGEVTEVLRFPMSLEDYLKVPDRPRNEWVDGEVIVMPPASEHRGTATVNLAVTLKQGLPGLRVSAETGFRMAHSIRGPDLMVRAQPAEDGFVTDAPVLVVEIHSRNTRREDRVRKPKEYAEAGVGQYWMVDPRRRTIEVLELDEGDWREVLRLDDEHPTGSVSVGEYGVVDLDLAAILDR